MNKKKIYKIIIKLIAGLVLVIYITAAGIIMGSKTVKASSMTNAKYTTEYKIDNTKNINSTNTIAMAVEKEMNLMSGLEQIGKIYNFKDIKFLKFIHDMEKKVGLPKHELMGLINGESRFVNESRIEKDGIVSYGCCQMRIGTATDAYKKIQPILKETGIKLQPPTESLLKNNREYTVKFTACYLKYLHELHPNQLQALTAYNAGIGSTIRFKSRDYKYSYTIMIQERITEFASIIGEFY